jgi:hypothetical protein
MEENEYFFKEIPEVNNIYQSETKLLYDNRKDFQTKKFKLNFKKSNKKIIFGTVKK